MIDRMYGKEIAYEILELVDLYSYKNELSILSYREKEAVERQVSDAIVEIANRGLTTKTVITSMREILPILEENNSLIFKKMNITKLKQLLEGSLDSILGYSLEEEKVKVYEKRYA